MIIKKIKNNRGFVILFAVTLSAILLSIALGVANIALKEIKFGTSAKDTNDAFFAADTGAECALNNDKPSSNHFPIIGAASQITCAGSPISVTFSADPSNSNIVLYNFVVPSIGGNSVSCANVSVSKDVTKSPSVITTVTSKGYNIMDNASASCLSSNPNRIERELIVSY